MTTLRLRFYPRLRKTWLVSVLFSPVWFLFLAIELTLLPFLLLLDFALCRLSMAVKAAKDTWAVGCQVELATTLTDEETVKGEVFAYDDKTKTLVLREPYGGSKGNTHLGEKEGYNIRMLNTNYVTKIVSAEPAKQPQAQVLPYVCTKRAEER